MQILPVLDLMRGQVVRGVGGRRDEYRPVQGMLCANAQPATVARAMAELGFQTAYVADLDAIAGAEPAWLAYRQILDTGLDLWVDAGASDAARARAIGAFSARIVVIAGLESLAGPDRLAALLAEIGAPRLAFSLDLKEGRPLTDAPAWGRSPDEIAAQAVALGVQRMIVLDLARVGEGQGLGTLALCHRLRQRWPTLVLISGGGVRHRADLQALAEAGCDAALVASALHDGRITRDDVARQNVSNADFERRNPMRKESVDS